MDNNKKKIEITNEKDLSTETTLINDINSRIQIKQSFLLIHTQIAKGVASLMLLYHHLLRPGNTFNKNFINELVFFGFDFRKYSSIFFKITTCSYTFLSGIGLYYSLIKFKSIKDMYYKSLKNFLRLMVIFWIILIFVYPKGLQTGLFDFEYSTIISCIFAVYSRKGNWWYIRMHFTLLAYAPLFIRLFNESNYKNKIIPIIIFYLIYSIIRILKYYLMVGGIIKIFFQYFDYFTFVDIILSFLSGILTAKYNIMSIFNNSKIDNFYYSLFSIFSSIYIRSIIIKNEADTKIDFLIVPLFLLPITCLISRNKIISSFFCLIGKHSTNFWFLHGYFYDNYYLDILSLPKYSSLCYLWLIILTLFGSYIVNIALIPIINFINNKGFNYKGYFHFLNKKN